MSYSIIELQMGSVVDLSLDVVEKVIDSVPSKDDTQVDSRNLDNFDTLNELTRAKLFS
jgi:hypothetical protein